MDQRTDDDDLLACVCGELNFKHSLLSEGVQMRRLTMVALAHSASVLDNLATGRHRLSELRSSRDNGDRLCLLAERARVNADRARQLVATVEAIGLDEPRPSGG